MARAFEASTPASVLRQHRHVWRRAANVFEVISRNGKHRYRVVWLPGQAPECSCRAGQSGRPCWHAALVLERREKEVAA